jgi:hypothetical protein
MLNNERHYLDHIILFVNSVEAEPTTEWGEGYVEALEDIRYACSLSKTALDSHLRHWLGTSVTDDAESGYQSACIVVAEKLTEINESDKWSFE